MFSTWTLMWAGVACIGAGFTVAGAWMVWYSVELKRRVVSNHEQ